MCAKRCTMCRHSLWHETQLLSLEVTVPFSASAHILSQHSQTSERPFKLSFRSKPVFDVTAHLHFEPQVISTENISCPGRADQTFQMGSLKVCFTMVEATKSKAGRGLRQSARAAQPCPRSTALTLCGFSGALKSGLNISCVVVVDPMRQTPRGFFSRTDNQGRTRTATQELLSRESCFTYPVYMAVRDRILPLLPPFGRFVVLFCTYRDTFV